MNASDRLVPRFSLPGVSYSTASTVIFAYAVGLLPCRLVKKPDSQLEGILMLVELLLIPVYLIGARSLSKEKRWVKPVIIAAAGVDLIALVSTLLRFTWLAWIFVPQPMNWIPTLALTSTALTILTMAILVAKSSSAGCEPIDEMERSANSRRGRTWFWRTIAIGFALPIVARAAWWFHFVRFSQPGKVMLITGDFGMTVQMIRESWPFVFLAILVSALMSSSVQEDELSLRARKVIVGSGLAVASVVTPLVWYRVFAIGSISLESQSFINAFSTFMTAFLYRIPGAVGVSLVMFSLIVMGCVWSVEHLLKSMHVIGSLTSRPTPT
jgi:hypothetical protein